MKRRVLISLVVVVTLAATASVVWGKGAAEKATGEVGYAAYSLQRWVEFNAHETIDYCYLDVVGDWVLSVNYLGSLYNHDMTIDDQSGGVLAGSGSYPAGGPSTVHWSLVDSTIAGTTVHLVLDYDESSYVATLDGTIASDGSMSGNWTSNIGQSGSWSTTSGPSVYAGCEGKGDLHYWDANGDWYYVDVQHVNVHGEHAYFAGPVTSASQSGWTDYWLFAKVHDGGEPAYMVDHIWGSFVTTEADARAGVATMANPGDGPFAITSGNLQVHTY